VGLADRLFLILCFPELHGELCSIRVVDWQSTTVINTSLADDSTFQFPSYPTLVVRGQHVIGPSILPDNPRKSVSN